MRFILIKDPHLAFGFQNRIRKNYRADVEAKLKFISDYCVQNNVNKIVFTGDVFDNQKESQWTFRQYAENKKILKKYFVDKNIKIYSPAGNHDFFNGRESIEGTVFGEMVEEKIIAYIGKEPYIENDIFVWGVDWSADKSKVIRRLDLINNNKGTNFAVIHMNCLKESNIFTDFTWDFLVTSFPNIQYWGLGHYHIGTGVTEYKNKVFLDPWNLVRVARDYNVKMDNFNVNMIDIEIFENSYSAQVIQIPHKSFKEAFIEEYVNLIQYDKRDQFEFFKDLNLDTLVQESISEEDLIDKIIQEKNFNPEIKKLVLQYLN